MPNTDETVWTSAEPSWTIFRFGGGGSAEVRDVIPGLIDDDGLPYKRYWLKPDKSLVHINKIPKELENADGLVPCDIYDDHIVSLSENPSYSEKLVLTDFWGRENTPIFELHGIMMNALKTKDLQKEHLKRQLAALKNDLEEISSGPMSVEDRGNLYASKVVDGVAKMIAGLAGKNQ